MITGVTILAGCGGGGGGNSSPTPITYANRTYAVSNANLPGTGIASMTVVVQADIESLVASLTIVPPSKAAQVVDLNVAASPTVTVLHPPSTTPTTRQSTATLTISLTGSLTNEATGAYTLTGSYVDPVTGDTVIVTVTGTLPNPPDSQTGGLIQITIGAASYKTGFSSDPTVYPSATPSPTPMPSVSINPSTVPSLSVGGATQQFTATVSNTVNQNVTWSLQEGAAAGSISNNGLYASPGGSGTYHVIATSQQDTTKTAIATVTVVSSTINATIKSERPLPITVSAPAQVIGKGKP